MAESHFIGKPGVRGAEVKLIRYSIEALGIISRPGGILSIGASSRRIGYSCCEPFSG